MVTHLFCRMPAGPTPTPSQGRSPLDSLRQSAKLQVDPPDHNRLFCTAAKEPHPARVKLYRSQTPQTPGRHFEQLEIDA